MKRNSLIAITTIFLLLVLFILLVMSSRKHQSEDKSAIQMKSASDAEVTIVAQDLHVPWSLAFLPDGTLLATERNGNVRVISENSRIIEVPNVAEAGEGGLLGLAVHPDFGENSFIYLYFTARPNGQTINRVVRYVFDGTTISEEKIIIDNIPGGTNHNGGRIAFGPDSMLYVTTGDSGNENLAQDTTSLAGKILRLHDDGSIPADNPFGNAVYSYGHRNPQGLAWDDDGNLWESEHGRSGVQSGLDEINLIEKGANYGWSVIEGNETQDGMRNPVIHSSATTTWAPSGIVFHDGKLYFAGLRGRALYEAEILPEGKLSEVKVHLKDKYGRLRGVVVGPDGNLYITTSNQDGRGDPSDGDDKILRISL